MTEKIEILKAQIKELQQKNKQLEKDNRLISDELTYFRERCEDLEADTNKLTKDNDMVKTHETILVKENRRLLSEHRDLTNKVNWQKRQISALKFRCHDQSKHIMELESEIQDMRFTRKMLTAEEAGAAFARELLGKPMALEDIAIEAAENCYRPYNGDDF